MNITASEFQQNFGRYQDEAQQAPVSISKNGRPHLVLVSASLFEVLVKGRIARSVADLDDAAVKAIASSAVDPKHARLDEVIKDWKPTRRD